MNYADIFLHSLERVSTPELRDKFFDGFYRRFISRHSQVAIKFKDTDMARQKDMLRESFSEMCAFFVTKESNPYLLTLARIHGVRGRDIPVDMYDLWLNCLIETVREVDPECAPNVELAWRLVMAPGIEYMKFFRDR